MSTWATRRKLLYASFAMLLLIGAIVPLVWRTYPAPSCSDGKQNQGEQGIDCGGPCTRICSATTDPLRVVWTRPFTVSPGVASAAALVLNPNAKVGADSVAYRLRLYDDQNILIAERQGKTIVPANSQFPIFEGGIPVGNRSPSRAFLEFMEEPNWRLWGEAPALTLKNQQFMQSPSSLEADVVNPAVDTVRNVRAYAVIFDVGGNAIGASKTLIDRIPGGGATHAVFTWLTPFASSSAVSERIYLLAPRIP